MRLDPPLDPSAEQARDWLASELAKGEYATHETLLQRLASWINDLFDRLISSGSGGGGGGDGVGMPVWLAATIIVLLALFLISRSVGFGRSHRRNLRSANGVLDGDARSAQEHRRLAASAYRRGDYDEAVLAAYRAVARGAIERTVLDDQLGRTAYEVALGIAPAFPAYAQDALTASRAFDAVRYGHLHASQEAAQQVIDTDARIAAARPTFAPVPEPAQ